MVSNHSATTVFSCPGAAPGGGGGGGGGAMRVDLCLGSVEEERICEYKEENDRGGSDVGSGSVKGSRRLTGVRAGDESRLDGRAGGGAANSFTPHGPQQIGHSFAWGGDCSSSVKQPVDSLKSESHL